MSIYSPICLFVYNRLEKIQQTVKALQENYLAKESDLFIFSDNAKIFEDNEKINAVRKYIHSIVGFKTITIYEMSQHKGLACSIIDGVTQILDKYDKVIVIEDDLLTSPNFLDFINQGLDFYANHNEIFNINGYSMNLRSLNGYQKDYYLGYRASSWGWGTWKNRWDSVDWYVNDYNFFRYNLNKNLKFMKGGSDLPFMLWNQRRGLIDSWAIIWCYNQFNKGKLSIISSKSKVVNIGFDENSTNTKKGHRFETNLDSSNLRRISFDEKPIINNKLVKEFRSKYSFLSRILDRFLR